MASPTASITEQRCAGRASFRICGRAARSGALNRIRQRIVHESSVTGPAPWLVKAWRILQAARSRWKCST